MLWALPRGARHAVRDLAARPRMRTLARVLAAPLVVLVLHAAVRWLWHLPVAFDAALGSEWLHAVQHATFLGSAALFWWTVLQGRFGRAGYGLGVAFVFLTMLHSGVLAAMLSLSDGAWYAAHDARTAASGLDPVADQRRGGLYMWVPAGTLMMGTALGLFAAWLGEARRRISHSPHAGLRGR
jgi:putative membrane protein